MAGTSRGEQAGTETRRRIIEAARTRFARQGLHGTTLEEIAQQAGVTRPGLLHHFGSKHALLTAVFEHQTRDQLGAWLPAGVSLPDNLEDLDPADPAHVGIDFLTAIQIATEVARHNATHPDNIRLAHLSVLEPGSTSPLATDWARTRHRRVRQLIAAAVRRSIHDGTVRADADADGVGVLVVTAFEGVESQWLADQSFDIATHFEQFAALITRDLAGNEITAHSQPTEDSV